MRIETAEKKLREEYERAKSELRAMVECLHLDKDTFWKIFMTDN